MRIATSTIYDQQIQSIDDLSAQYQNIGQQLSTGKKLSAPSDSPATIAQSLTLTGTLAGEAGDVSNAVNAQNKLTFTDSALAALTDVLSSARSLAISGASDIIPNGSQRPLIGKQMAGLVDQAIALANSQYGNEYVFAGSGPRSTPPVVPQGNPPTGVIFNGNLQTKTELINGQNVAIGTTLQAGFNYAATDGGPDAFQLLATLRDTLNKEPAGIQSALPVNASSKIIYGPTSGAAQTTLAQLAGAGSPSATTLTFDNSVPANTNASIEIDGTNNVGAPGSQVFTFVATDTIANVLAKINAGTATTGVTASWNDQSQRLTLLSTATNSPPFLVTDVATPAPPAAVAATNTSNFRTVFKIDGPIAGSNSASTQVSVTTNLSTQLNDIDQVVNAILSARASLGQQIQNLAATQNQVSSQTVDNKSVQSGYQDTDVGAATSRFSQTQTALQAAYATTSRLEGKTLIDFL